MHQICKSSLQVHQLAALSHVYIQDYDNFRMLCQILWGWVCLQFSGCMLNTQPKQPHDFLRKQWSFLYKCLDGRRFTFASFETAGREGNSTLRALIIVSSRSILSWVWSCPNGRLPKHIWYKRIPADQTSTCCISSRMLESMDVPSKSQD